MATGPIKAIPQKFNKTFVDINENKSVSTTYAYTGFSYTVPAWSEYLLEFQAMFNTSSPQEIGIQASSSSAALYECYARTDKASHVCVCGYTSSSPITFYLFARYSSAGTNRMSVRGTVTQYPSD